MKKIVLSAVAITTLAMTGVQADSASDIAEMKAMMKQMNQRLAKLETENKQLKSKISQKEKKATHTASKKKKTTTVHKKKKPVSYTSSTQSEKIAALEEKVETIEQKREKETPVFSKTSKLKFSGLHYIGARHRSYSENFGPKDSETHFETRRNYIQVKGYFFDDPKSYVRVTLDTFQDKFDPDDTQKSNADGSWLLRLKYAYIWLNDIGGDLLPGTGVEFGQAHRPWIDYEEHNSFFYRSVSKVFVETKNAADLTNSADVGVNIKTKLPYFSSEFGVYNGEGYHAPEFGHNVSFEWRTTAHLLGTGLTQKDHPTKVTYWDASFFGQYNMDNDKYTYLAADGTEDGQTYKFFGLHTVYNQPAFMIGAQYVKSEFDYEDITNPTKDWYKKSGEGYSAHAVARFGDDYEYEVFGRYDHWEPKNANDNATGLESFSTDNFIYGVAWQQNKNLKWLLNGVTYKADEGLNYKGKEADDFTDIMLTAEVKW